MITFNPVSNDFFIQTNQVFIERNQHWRARVCCVTKISSLWRRFLGLSKTEQEFIYLLNQNGRLLRLTRKQLLKRFTFHGEFVPTGISPEDAARYMDFIVSKAKLKQE